MSGVLHEQALRYTAEGLKTHGYVTRRDLGCREIRNAVVTRRKYFPDRSYLGAVYDGRGELIRSTLRYNQGDIFPVDPAQIDDLSALSARPSPHRTALYGGILFPILGHFFFESLARLWPLLWCGQQGGERLPVCFHSWPGLDPATFMDNPLYRETLAALGIGPRDVLVIDHPERFDTLIVPDPASAYHLHLDQRMVAVFDHVAAGILGPQAKARPGGRRVYLSRSGWTENRRIVNEEVIDALMAERGIEVLHTERMTPRELVGMLVSADTVVATDGSQAHLAVFCRPGIRVVMLDTRPVPTQFAISLLRGFRALHVPLFQTPLYRMEQGITDPALLGQLVDQALS